MAKKAKKGQVVKANPGTSEFNGGLLGYIGITLLQIVIIVFTLTLGTAWAVCKYHRWYAKHTKINGKQLVFDGKGIQLFGKYIAWGFLTFITLGIYGLWLCYYFEENYRAVILKRFVAEESHAYPLGYIILLEC